MRIDIKLISETENSIKHHTRKAFRITARITLQEVLYCLIILLTRPITPQKQTKNMTGRAATDMIEY